MQRRGSPTSRDRPSLSGACAQAVGVTYACVGVFAVVSFAVAGNRLARRLTEEGVVEYARICAASLAQSRNGDLRKAAEGLRAQYRPVVAVASVGVSGDLQWVLDTMPAYRQVGRRVALMGNKPAAVTLTVGGEKQTIWGVKVPLNGGKARSAREVLFLFRLSSGAGAWARATAAFGCVLAIGSLLGLVSFRCWFDRRVITPLAALCDRPVGRAAGPEAEATPDLGGWRETRSVAGMLRDLRRGLAASEAAMRRIKAECQSRLRKTERGFDRRLRRAEDRATVDPLTGMRNRTYLDANLARIVNTCRAGDVDLSVVMIDLDNFKQLNDTCGHKAGDDLLRCTGELFRATLRPTDHAIRYGGDEFLLLLPAVCATEARRITERILKLFSQSAALIDVSRSVSLSAGVASRKADGRDDGWTLIAKADAALYDAKREGKNAVAVSSTYCDRPAGWCDGVGTTPPGQRAFKPAPPHSGAAGNSELRAG